MERIIVSIDGDLKELIPGFLENRREDVEAIASALEKGEMGTIRIIGHSMKGSGGGYGFDRITEIGTGLEEAAKYANTAAVRKQLAHLQDYLSRIEIVYT